MHGVSFCHAGLPLVAASRLAERVIRSLRFSCRYDSFVSQPPCTAMQFSAPLSGAVGPKVSPAILRRKVARSEVVAKRVTGARSFCLSACGSQSGRAALCMLVGDERTIA